MAVVHPTEASPRERAAGLRRRLESLAEALGTRDVTALLACEAALADGLAPLAETASAESSMSAAERAAMAADVAAARQALARCRALGAANQLLADVTLDALGRTGVYGRDGASQARSPRGRDVVTRA